MPITFGLFAGVRSLPRALAIRLYLLLCCSMVYTFMCNPIILHKTFAVCIHVLYNANTQIYIVYISHIVFNSLRTVSV